MTAPLHLTRGAEPPHSTLLTARTLAAILAGAGVGADDRSALFVDLSLGAWVPNQAAAELRSQLGLAAPTPATPPGGATADIIGALIDRETAGHRPTQQTFADAGEIIGAIIGALQPRSPPRAVIVLAPLDGSALDEDNLLFLEWLSVCGRGRLSITIAGRVTPKLPRHWSVAYKDAVEIGGDTGPRPPPIPGLITRGLADQLLSDEAIGGLRPLGGDALLVPPEQRADGSLSDADRRQLAVWAGIAADPWLRAFAAVRAGVPEPPLIPLGWRALSAGSHQLALRLVEAAIAQQGDEDRRAQMTSVAQGMRIGVQAFAAVAAEADPAPGLEPELRGRLLQHKGWGLVMTGRSEEALPCFDTARALLRTDPPSREFLYLLNINALVHLRCGDLPAALALEQEIDRMLAATPRPDWHLIYINALNTARLHLRQKRFAAAEALFLRAFDTSRGVWTTGDLVSQSVYFAAIAAGRQALDDLRRHWLDAALFWASDPLPEAAPTRLAQLLLGKIELGKIELGKAGMSRRQMAEAISETLLHRLLAVFGREEPTGEPPAIVRAGDAPQALFADPGAAVVGCSDWAVVTAPMALAPGCDGPAHRRLRTLLHAILCERRPEADLGGAATLVIDDQDGRGLPAGGAQTLDLALRRGVGRAWFDGAPVLSPGPERERYVLRQVVDWSPAVDPKALDDTAAQIAFRRYRAPYVPSPDEAALLRHLDRPRSVEELLSLASSQADALLGTLEAERVISIGLPETAAPDAPSAETARVFSEQGFAVLDGFVSPGELAVLANYVEEAVSKAAADTRPPSTIRSGHRGDPERGELIWLRSPQDYAPGLAECAAVLRARRYGAALLEVAEESISISTRIFSKPARSGSVVPWHQDAAYRPDDQDRLSLNIWIPLDEATVESGCLHFVPRSHRAPLQPHSAYARDPSGLTLEAPTPADQEIVPCPVKVGAASVHQCRTLHQSPPNLSDHPRRALVVVCEVAG